MSLDGKVTQVLKAKRAEIEKLHEKTFRGWVNARLKSKNITTKNIFEDFKDGLVLIALFEVLTKEEVKRKYHKKPVADIHKLENITIAMEHINTQINVSVRSQDILEGQSKQILGLMWRLILHFGVAAHQNHAENLSAANKMKAAKQQLLEWLQAQTAGYKDVNIQDFQDSWWDGLGFAALVHKYDPSLINFDALSKDNPKENLATAFKIAEEKLGIPALIDPEDMLNEDKELRPDDQCVITYLSEFPIAFLKKKEIDFDRLKKEEEEKRKLEEERKRQEEEARRREEEERRRREEEERKRQEEENRAALEAERKKLEEEKRKLEEERKLDEERRRQLEDDERKKKEDEEERKRREKEEKKRKKREEREREEEERRRREEEGNEDDEKRRKELEDEFENERKKLEAENDKLKRQLEGMKGKLIGRMKVVVEEARGLKKVDIIGKSDPYCMLFLERQKEKTSVMKKQLNPKWMSQFEFYVSDPEAALEVTVFDCNRFLRDIFMGKVAIPVKTLKDGETIDKWFALEGKKGKDKKITGEVKLSITYSKA